MSEENRKTERDNKILSFQITEEDLQDPETDRFVRESLIREADELEREINSKPELAGIEAPEGMFESIVAELKARGVWEEEEEGKSAGEVTETEKSEEEKESASVEGEPGAGTESLEAIYAQLPEEDQKALELGRQVVQKREAKAGKRRRRKKFLKVFGVAAACLGVLFGFSMTSAANRRLVKRMWDGLMMNLEFRMDTDYSGEEESVRSKSKEEIAAMEEIREKTGAPVIEFCYLPKGMKYQGYEIVERFETVLFYSYQDTIFNVTIIDVDKEGSYYYTYDGEAVLRETIANKANIEAKIWEVNLDIEEETYVVEIEHDGWRYVLDGMLPFEEMKKIVEYLIIL